MANKSSTDQFENAITCLGEKKYLLRLYVRGETPNSKRAIENTEKICKERLHVCYELEIIDIYEHPERAKKDQILAVPILIKMLPEPLRRIIGDQTDIGNVLVGLNLIAEPQCKSDAQ